MIRKFSVMLLTGIGLFCGADVASGQEILIVAQKPTMGTTLFAYNVNGSFTMGAGTEVAKVLVTLQVKQGNQWFDVQLNKDAAVAILPTPPGSPQAGSYSFPFSDNYNRMNEYRVYAKLFKKRVNGTTDPNDVKTSENADVPRN